MRTRPKSENQRGQGDRQVRRGGNKSIHRVLNMSVHRLIHRHNEMFGIWGCNYWQKKKAANARKLSVVMYYIMETGMDFTYENYHSIRNIDVLDISVEDLVLINRDFKRYIRILKDDGINMTVDLDTAFITCSLESCQGLRKKFFELLKDFLDQHVTYRQMYDEIQKTQQRKGDRCQ